MVKIKSIYFKEIEGQLNHIGVKFYVIKEGQRINSHMSFKPGDVDYMNVNAIQEKIEGLVL
ncbi:hypothetical protein [Piscibacillus halophilus]|uniref:hypothetical protein n=1 Tax=Piscibacillus halophilus TaxID=571933 RepID=UPI00158BB95D|nr:hypothetical protein [Piscibacillus halophilus]